MKLLLFICITNAFLIVYSQYPEALITKAEKSNYTEIRNIETEKDSNKFQELNKSNN